MVERRALGSLACLVLFPAALAGGCASGISNPFKNTSDFDRTFIAAAQTWDLDKNGTVACDEWVRYISTEFRQADTNGDGALDAVLSVESVGIYKPAPEVYRLVTARFGCAPQQVLFMSSNGWDVAGAAAFGFRSFWANRRAEPVDRLPGRPDHIAPDLSPVPEIATR